MGPVPERASALSLRLDAAGGGAKLIDELTRGLAASAEAHTFAARTPT